MDKKRGSKGKNRMGEKEEAFATGDKSDEGKKDEVKYGEVKRDEGKNDKGKKDEVIVIVNGKRLPMGNFPKEIIKNVVFAMVYSLRGGEEAEEVEIKIKK